MSTRNKVILCVILLATSYAAGRYTTPQSIKIVEVEKKVAKDSTKTEKDSHKKVVTKKVTHPDGTTDETTTTTDDTSSSKQTKSVVADDKSKSSEIIKSSGILTIEALAGVNPLDGKFAYGASISRNLIGPIRLGAWGLTSGQIGVSLGLGF